MFTDFLKFLVGFVVVLFLITLFLYPVDDTLPWVVDILPMLKGVSIFDILQENDSFTYVIILGGFLAFVLYQVK